MLIPYSTDAPIYYWPFATAGTIVINLLIHFMVAALPESQLEWVAEHFILVYGDWNPIQWLTANYLHADFVHVSGNMIVLWGIGVVVEGKIGWWRFLALYNGLGIVQCGVEQTLMIMASRGGSLGASGIIYGMIAIAMVWAPRNELSCIVMFGYRITTWELPISTYAAISIGIEMLLGMLSVMAMSAMGTALAMTSQFLHLMGAATGFAVGAAMVKWKWVDCENWDLFSVMQGRHAMTREQLAAVEMNSAEGKARMESLQQQMQTKLHQYLAAGETKAALALHRRGRHQFGNGWKLSEDEHVKLISGLRKAEEWNDAVEMMVEYLQSPQPRESAVRLALAQILLERLNRPRQALKVLALLDLNTLPQPQKTAFIRLQQRAEQAAEEDPFEVAAEEW
jgi:membrane associated rhomboid family serine protease